MDTPRDEADGPSEAVQERRARSTETDIHRQLTQTLSMSVCGLPVRNRGGSRRPPAGATEAVDNEMPPQRSPRLDWLFPLVVVPGMPNEARATESQFKCSLGCLATNQSSQFFNLFDNCVNGVLTTEELVYGFRKLIKDSPREHTASERLSANIFKHSQTCVNGMSLQAFQNMLNDGEFQTAFMDIFRDGDFYLRNEFCEAMERLACCTNDEKYLMYLSREVKAKSGTNGHITKDAFKDILGTDKRSGDTMVDRFFVVHSDNGGLSIEESAFVSLLAQFILGSDDRKINFLFKLWDHDDDGELSHEDIKKTLENSIKESKVSFSEATRTDLVHHFIKAILHQRRPKRFTSIVERPNAIPEEDEEEEEEKEGLPAQLEVDDVELGLDTTMSMGAASYTISDSQGVVKPIQKSAFRTSLLAHPDLIRNLTFGGTHLSKVDITERGYEKRTQDCCSYFKTHKVVIFFILFLVLLNVGLAVEVVFRWLDLEHDYRIVGGNNGWFVTARVGGQLLNLNCAMVFLLICRQCITLLRKTFLSRLLPFDHHIEIHKWVGIWVFVLSCVHASMHVANICWRKYFTENLPHNNTDTVVECLFTTKCKLTEDWLWSSAVITGWPLLIIIVVMVIAAHPTIRQKGYFEVFFGIHHLFVPFVILLYLHAPRFWKWFMFPGLLYLIERILRFGFIKKLRFGTRSMKLMKAELLPSNVVMLQMARPAEWVYEAGDYIFIKIREISKTEYHPFTISSSPEIPGYITLHIQALGNWTKKLQEVLKEANIALKRKAPNYVLRGTEDVGVTIRQKSSLAERLSTLALSRGMSRRSLGRSSILGEAPDSPPMVESTAEDKQKIEVFVDGPYGTPSRHIFQAEHAVLVCTGVGVTPFSSILQTIYHRYSQFKHQCPNCDHVFYQDPYRAFRMKKVDFYWVNRNHDCFEWFTDVLRDLEKAFEQEERRNKEKEDFLDINFFHTGALQPRVINKVALNLALDFVYDSHDMDLLSGLRRARVQPGRPNWGKELDRLQQTRRGKITVFFCGNPQVSSVLKTECYKRGINFRQEVF